MAEPIGDEPQTDMDRVILEILRPIMVSLMECDFYDDPDDHYFDAYFNDDHRHQPPYTHILCIDANGDELWIYVMDSRLERPRDLRLMRTRSRINPVPLPDFSFEFADPGFLDKVRSKLNEIIYGDDV